MPVLPEKGEEGGAQVSICWNSCGGLGGNVRFTMVSRGPSPRVPYMPVFRPLGVRLQTVFPPVESRGGLDGAIGG